MSTRTKWRTGRRAGRTIYAQVGSDPSQDDELIGMMDNPDLAAVAVRDHNEALEVVEIDADEFEEARRDPRVKEFAARADKLASGITSDRAHLGLVPSTPGGDVEPAPQNSVYLVLSDKDRAQGFVRPLRRSYVHSGGCGAVTTMGEAIAETYARDPHFYGGTYCVGCSEHRPVGADGEFTWDDGSGQEVGT